MAVYVPVSEAVYMFHYIRFIKFYFTFLGVFPSLPGRAIHMLS